MILGQPSRRRFSELSEAEVLALAISSEEDDARIYATYAEQLRGAYPATSAMFDEMTAEEDGHRKLLIDSFQRRFGKVIPLIRREHVAGYYSRRPIWLVQNLGLARIRAEAARMEDDAAQFYVRAAQASSDPDTRKLLGDLAAAERQHEHRAEELKGSTLDGEVGHQEDDKARRQFILTWVQPGLAGLMDGSVSTLAPIFATAFATRSTFDNIHGGARGLSRRGNLDGIHRGSTRRWCYFRAWVAAQARTRVRNDDNLRWPRSRVAVLDPAILDRDSTRCVCSVRRVVGDCLDSESIHGDTIRPRRISGRCGRRLGAGGRHSDRRELTHAND
jgi:rubrerythrin